MLSNKNAFFKHFSAFFIFSLASIYITFPLLFHLGDYSTGIGDELLIAWIHSWVVHALFTNPLSIFNANIYYPYQNSLAYSDLFITGSLLTAPFVYLIGQPIAANNITLISSILFLGFTIYLLSLQVSKNYLSSLLAGILVVFSPVTLSYAVQIQMIEIYWVPLSILFYLLYLKNKKTKYFILFLASFLLQFYNSFLPAYFIIFSVVIISIFNHFENREKFRIYLSRKNLVLILLTFLLMIPLMIPYFQVSTQFHYTRDLRDTIHFALQPEDLLYPGENTRLASSLIRLIPTNQFSQNNEFKPGYLGFIFSFLLVLVISFLIIKRKKPTFYDKSFISIATIGIVLSLGPFLHLGRHTIHFPVPIPLPYLLFYYILPGFQGFRNSQRWEMLFVIAIAILISLIFSNILKNISFKKQLIIYGILFLGIIVEFLPFTFVSIPQKKDFPKIYSWMAGTQADSKFIIIPAYTWSMQPNVGNELYREYFSTSDFRPMVNGYSGFSPPPWQNFISTLHENFPNKTSVNLLQSIGIQYVIIDNGQYNREYKMHQSKYSGEMIVSQLKKNKNFLFVENLNNFSIFQVIPTQKLK